MECHDYGLTRSTERKNLNLNPLQREEYLLQKLEKLYMNFQMVTVFATTVGVGWTKYPNPRYTDFWMIWQVSCIQTMQELFTGPVKESLQ